MTDKEIEAMTREELEMQVQKSINDGVNIRLALDIAAVSEDLAVRYIRDCHLKAKAINYG